MSDYPIVLFPARITREVKISLRPQPIPGMGKVSDKQVDFPAGPSGEDRLERLSLAHQVNVPCPRKPDHVVEWAWTAAYRASIWRHAGVLPRSIKRDLRSGALRRARDLARYGTTWLSDKESPEWQKQIVSTLLETMLVDQTTENSDLGEGSSFFVVRSSMFGDSTDVIGRMALRRITEARAAVMAGNLEWAALALMDIVEDLQPPPAPPRQNVAQNPSASVHKDQKEPNVCALGGSKSSKVAEADKRFWQTFQHGGATRRGQSGKPTMLQVELRPRVVPTGLARARMFRPSGSGVKLRLGRVAQAYATGKSFGLFERKRKDFGVAGSVLIDASGSMGVTPEVLEKLMRCAPGAVIAYYNGGMSSDGYLGALFVTARQGRLYTREYPSRGGGNEVDLEALTWLLHQKGPRVFVTDGEFCGGLDGNPEKARRMLAYARARGQVITIGALAYAVRAFEAAKRRKIPLERLSDRERTSWAIRT